MKKILVFVFMLMSCANAQALSSIRNIPMHNHYSSYDSGYRAGKNHAYNNVARTVAIVGIATVAAVIIYQAGKDSRWTMTDEGNIGYRF